MPLLPELKTARTHTQPVPVIAEQVDGDRDGVDLVVVRTLNSTLIFFGLVTRFGPLVTVFSPDLR